MYVWEPGQHKQGGKGGVSVDFRGFWARRRVALSDNHFLTASQRCRFGKPIVDGTMHYCGKCSAH